MIVYAKISPTDTLEIVKLYFLNYLALRAEHQGWIHINDKMMDTFKLLYKNSETKQGTEDLINELLPHGNGVFWKLKEVIE